MENQEVKKETASVEEPAEQTQPEAPIEEPKSPVEPEIAKLARRESSIARTIPKVGLSESVKKATMRELQLKAFSRRMLLTVPKDILDENPDKHFVWVNMNRLETNGMWHPDGYELFKSKDHMPDNLVNKFNRSVDGYLHRSEMVLAYLPVEEYNQRKMEEEILKGNRDVTDIITGNPNLAGFEPTAEAKIGTSYYKTKKKTEVTHA